MPSVLSVQSRVAYGHVGNAAAVFPLQCLGIEAWALDTVAFFFRYRALALADIATPNRFELEYLTGSAIGSLGEAAEAVAQLRSRGPGIVLVTSLDTAPDRLTMLAAGPDGAWAVETPRLAAMLNGCGDVTAALFLGHLLNGEALPDALARTAASMFAVIETTVGMGRYELALVAAREELARPSQVFLARRV